MKNLNGNNLKGVLNPLMEQNKVNVVKVKEEIEDTFQTFIRKLTQQKDDLFTILDEIEKEKYICNKLKQELNIESNPLKFFI